MSNGQPTLHTVAPTDARLIYEPEDAWDNTGCSFGDSTFPGTGTAGSSVSFAFNGTFIAVYGILGDSPTNATFMLDGVTAARFTSSASSHSSSDSVALYSSSANLNAGEHTLNISNAEDGAYLCIDYLQYTGWQTSNVTYASDPSASTPSSTVKPSAPSHALSAGVISGIVTGSLALLVLIFMTILYACGWTCRGRRKIQPSRKKGVDIVLDELPRPPPPESPAGMDVLRKFLFLQGQNTITSKSSSGPTSQGTSSAMFTSVVVLTPPVSVSSSDNQRQNHAHSTSPVVASVRQNST